MNVHLAVREPLVEHGLAAAIQTGYRVSASEDVEDSEWDAFLARTPGGHHVQTSLWAQVKGLLGWRVQRLVVTQSGQIIAGAQLLMRPLPLIGAIGYVSQGPVFASEDPTLPKLLIDELHQVARRHRIQYLVVQPPSDGRPSTDLLPSLGFRLSPIAVAPTATVQIDLHQDRNEILAQMRKQTRRDIRHGLRQGMKGREGTEDDLPTFYHLLGFTSERQNFSPYSPQFFAKIWQVYRPRGYARLFLTEYNRNPVSAQLVIAFGDTVIAKSCGWSGLYGSLAPNHILDWTTIDWAKTHGYHYFDLEGIDPAVGRMILDGGSMSDTLKQQHGPSFYKLGFGGQVILLPRAYDYVYNPMLRWTYSAIFPRVASWTLVKKAIHRLQVR